jgi:hypothetical protein
MQSKSSPSLSKWSPAKGCYLPFLHAIIVIRNVNPIFVHSFMISFVDSRNNLFVLGQYLWYPPYESRFIMNPLPDTTHKSIVTFPNKCNTVLKNLLWKGQKTVGCLLIFHSLSLLASGDFTHFVLTPLHFINARRLNCYIYGPTR